MQVTKPSEDDPVSVPDRLVGHHVIPALFLGDHGFLRKLGSRHSDAEVFDLMAYALRLMRVGVAAGDQRCLRAARAAVDRARSGAVMYHTDAAVALNGRPLRYRRCGATLRDRLIRQGISIKNDPVLEFLEQFNTTPPVSDLEACKLVIDKTWIQHTQNLLEQYKPDVVTIGGDFLDMLLMLGRTDLAVEAITRFVPNLAELEAPSRPALVATLYVGAVEPKQTDPILTYVDGVMAPANRFGVAMLPNERRAKDWLRSTELPVVAMHALAGGRDTTHGGLSHAEELKVAATVIGASRPHSIRTLATAARSIFQGINT